MNTPLGVRLEPILEELSDTIMEHAADERGQYYFSDRSLLAATMIFSNVLADKAFTMTGIDTDSEAMGQGIRLLIKQYCGIDTVELTEKLMN